MGVSRDDVFRNQPLRPAKNARVAAAMAAMTAPIAMPAITPLLSGDVDAGAGLRVDVLALDVVVVGEEVVEEEDVVVEEEVVVVVEEVVEDEEVVGVDADDLDEDLEVVIAGCLIVVKIEGVPGGSYVSI